MKNRQVISPKRTNNNLFRDFLHKELNYFNVKVLGKTALTMIY